MSKTRVVSSAILAGSGINAMDDDNSYVVSSDNVDIDQEHIISLWDFTHLYTIGGIPVIDFIIVYIMLYIINKFIIKLEQKIIILATIIVTILYNLVFNKNVNLTWTIATIIAVCTILLIYLFYSKN